MSGPGSASVTGDVRGTALPTPVVRLGDHDRRLLRGAGLTGTLGSLLLLGVFVFVGALGLPDPFTPESLIRFPEIQYARATENVLYLTAVVLWAVHHDLLDRWLRATAPVLSAAARTVGSLGAAVVAAGALLNVATATTSETYEQSAEVDRSAVVVAWQAAQGVMDALLVTGALLLSAAVVLLGIALHRGPSRALSWGALVLGTAGTVAAVAAATNLPSVLIAVSILSTLAFHLAAGIHWLRLARG